MPGEDEEAVRVTARIVGVSWWRRTLARIRDRLHLWSGCECHVIDTPEGIGGQCIWCGRIYGWMTRAELRAVYPGSGSFACRASSRSSTPPRVRVGMETSADDGRRRITRQDATTAATPDEEG